jgi:hypothetical protein
MPDKAALQNCILLQSCQPQLAAVRTFQFSWMICTHKNTPDLIQHGKKVFSALEGH